MNSPFLYFLDHSRRSAWRARLCTFIVLLLGACAVYAAPVPAIPFDEDPCLTFDLFEKSEGRSGSPNYAELGWTSASLWSEGDLVLVDYGLGRMLRAKLDRQPEKAGLVEVVGLQSPESRPKYAYPAQDGRFLVFDDEAKKIVEVNPDFTVSSEREISTHRMLGESGLKLLTVYRFAPVGRGVLALADLEDTNKQALEERHFSRFILLGFDGSYALVGNRIPTWSDLRYRLTRDFAYIGSLNGVGWVLVMEDEAWLARVEWNDHPQLVRQQGFLEPEFTRLPGIRWFHDPKGYLEGQAPHPSMVMNQMYRFYRDVEDATMVTGIQVWPQKSAEAQGRVLVVAKEGIDRFGNTKWWILDVSPERGGAVQKQLHLPVWSESILLAGDEYLGIVEKGGIERLGNDASAFKLYRETLTAKRVHKSLLARKSLATITESYCSHVPPAE